MTHHEDITGRRDFASLTKDLDHVPELSMDIAADGYGGLDEMDIGFFEQEVSDTSAECFHLAFGEVSTFSDLKDN